MTWRVRELNRAQDRRDIERIDTGFETETVFDVVASERALTLVERQLQTPLLKRYSIREVFAPWTR